MNPLFERYRLGLARGRALAVVALRDHYAGAKGIELRDEATTLWETSTSRGLIAEALGEARGFREVVRDGVPVEDYLSTPRRRRS